MHQETALVATIAMGLVLALLGGVLAQKLRLPPLVGYLVAGIVCGPFSPGFVADLDLARQLAEIGVVLLMFGVGLHFSLDDLLEVRMIALPGAVGQILAATLIGMGLSWLWGWGLAAGLVFGLTLSVASTVVLLRALEERQALDSANGRIAVGWLIVEDLAMVLALVLLPALAGGSAETGGGGGGIAARLAGDNLLLAFLLTIGKVALFLALMLVVGRRAVPWLLAHVARTGSRELFTLAVLALALGIAYGSSELFGVSLALGAFFAGMVLSESDLSHQAAADSLPLQDAFAVLFFVSVGMLFDPTILVREPLAVAAVVLVIIFGKSLAAIAIVLVFRYPIDTAMMVAASLAQIGEFSFILIELGIGLQLVPEEARDLVLAGAILSISLNPLVFKTLDPVVAWLREHPRLLRLLERKGDRLSQLPTPQQSAWRDHAVIVGYGRVGSTVGQTLQAEGLPFVVVEYSRRRVEELRKRGIAAIFGDAGAPGVLEAASIDQARLLVVAIPDGFHAPRVVQLARRANPGIDTVVRSHSERQIARLEQDGVGMAIMGERQLALGMLRYALGSLGIEADTARRIVHRVRTSGEGGAYERRPDVETVVPEPE